MITALLWTMLAITAYAASLAACVHALWHKKDSRVALGWVLFILAVPYLGVIMYLIIGVSRVDSFSAHLLAKKAKAQTERDIPLAKKLISIREELDFTNDKDEGIPSIALVGQNLTELSLIGGNEIILLQNGEETYPQMLQAIDEAKSHVYLSTYIFKNGEISSKFCDALINAAKRDVDVRFIIDGMGDLVYSRKKPWKKLMKQGVLVERFLPIRIFPPSFSINLRTHRKVLVCDTVGFTGGMNISDDHMLTNSLKQKVQDTHYRCEGPISLLLQEAFLMDWAFLTNQASDTTIPPEIPLKSDKFCRLIFDGLGEGRNTISELLCGVISTAEKSVTIISPYFLPPTELVHALHSAVLRGVDVKIILPEANNHESLHRASRHSHPVLLKMGISIYYQKPPFAHTKLVLIDTYYTQIGSANIDPRSLYLNFELNMEIFSEDFSYTMTQYVNDVLEKSRQAELHFYEGLRFRTRLLDSILWLFSPYL